MIFMIAITSVSSKIHHLCLVIFITCVKKEIKNVQVNSMADDKTGQESWSYCILLCWAQKLENFPHNRQPCLS